MEKRCARLELAMANMKVKDHENNCNDKLGLTLTMRRAEALAGDCPISHKCCRRNRCALGVEQRWRAAGLRHVWLQQMQQPYEAALPSAITYSGKQFRN